MALITNVVKKIQAEKFTQFIDGQFVVDGEVIDNVLDIGGGNGVSMIPVIAYASAIDGTGFTLTNSDTLEYTATAVLDSTVTPVAADFTGKWYHRKGIPGATPDPVPGADGQQAGFRINYTIDTTEKNPNTGNIGFDNTNLALATKIYLNDTMPSGVDLSGVINQFTAGMMIMLRLNVNSSVTLAVFELTDVPTDNGDWFTIPVINRAKSSADFADLDQCTFQFFGGGGGTGTVDEAAVLAAGNFARFADNGAGGYKLVDNANVEVKAATNVFRLPAFTGITGVTDRPAANTFPHGTVVRLHQDCLVGAGSNPMGVELWADATNNIFRPHGHQVLFWNDYGLIATPPSVSLTAAGKFNLGGVGDPVIPAGLLNVGSRLRIVARLIKVGTTAPVLRVYLGTDLTTRTNNSQVWAQTVSATADLHLSPEPLVTFISATTALTGNRATRGGSGAAGVVTDATTLLNVAADMKATIEASTLSSDTVYLLSFGIIWEA